LNTAQLQPFLEDIFAQKTQELQIIPLKGGFSNLTYHIIFNQQNYIIRTPPAGASHIHKGHDMAREYKILHTLKPIYPKIPEVFGLCEDENIIGTPFYVMQKMEGTILRAGSKFSLTKEQRQILDKNLIENFAKLHEIDFENTPLKDLGKTENYTQRQTENVIKRYPKVQTDEIFEINEVFDWLSKNIPNTQKNAFLHNDYKYDNLVLDNDNLTNIVGVLDWELSTIGNAWADLGVMLSYITEKNDFETIKSFGITITEGTFSRKDFLEKYQEITQIEVKNIVFYYVLGMMRLAIIAQQIYFRYKQGFTQDERFKYLIFAVKDCIKTAQKAITDDSI
jgi:aminoglycoside phosphotransferase (APT) family kinase protein